MLTPSAVQNAKPQTKPYKLTDERSMFLLVTPAGGKLWGFKYRRPGTGKENLLSLGAYPDVSLKRAREKRDQARKLLADGIDPGAKRQAERTATPDIFLLGYLVRGMNEHGVAIAIGVPLLVRVAYHLYQDPVGALTVLVFDLIASIYYVRTQKLFSGCICARPRGHRSICNQIAGE